MIKSNNANVTSYFELKSPHNKLIQLIRFYIKLTYNLDGDILILI